MQDKVKSELKRMTTLGVISPVSEQTDWVSSMVATLKKNTEEIRLCIDPRDLNQVLKRPHHPTRTVEEVAAQMDGATVFSVLDAKCSFWQIPLDYQSSLLLSAHHAAGTGSSVCPMVFVLPLMYTREPWNNYSLICHAPSS